MPSGFGGTLTLYAVPQAKNVTLLGCYLHTGAPQAIQQRCDEIVSTLGLEGATAFPLAPTASYAAALNAAINKLSTSARPPYRASRGRPRPPSRRPPRTTSPARTRLQPRN